MAFYALAGFAAGTLLRRRAYIDELTIENHYALVSRVGPHLVYNALVIFDVRDPGYRDQVSSDYLGPSVCWIRGGKSRCVYHSIETLLATYELEASQEEELRGDARGADLRLLFVDGTSPFPPDDLDPAKAKRVLALAEFHIGEQLLEHVDPIAERSRLLTVGPIVYSNRRIKPSG